MGGRVPSEKGAGGKRAKTQPAPGGGGEALPPALSQQGHQASGRPEGLLSTLLPTGAEAWRRREGAVPRSRGRISEC